MSKLFNQSQAAAPPVTTSAGTGTIEEMLQEVQASQEVASTAVSVSRLESCRRINLTKNLRTPFICDLDEFTGRAAESYRALRTRILRSQAAQGFRSVVLSSALAGDGKTLNSLNLALCFAQLHNYPLLLIDSDLRTRGLTKAMHMTGRPGLVEVLSGKARPEEAICSTDLPNLYVLSAGGATASPPELLSDARWERLIAWCNECFRLTLVDSPPLLTIADTELITSVCDRLIVVVRALRTRREVLSSAIRQVEASKILGVIYNGGDVTRMDGYYGNYVGKNVTAPAGR